MPIAVRAPTRPRPLRARLGTRLIRAAGSGITGRTATVAESASATTVTGTRPADRQTGDYVIAHFSMSCTAAQFTGPGGSWVQLVAPTANAASETVAVYGMFDPSADPVGTSSAAAGRQTCIMQAYGGVDPTTPIDVAAATPTSGTLPVTISQVTTVTAGARLISGVTGDFSTGNWIGPPEMGLVKTQTSGIGRGAALADEVRPVAGATGSRQWSASSLVAAVGYLFALRPAPMPAVREYLSGEASASNITVNTGAGTVAGDLILAFHSNDFDTVTNLTAPTTGSWTLQATGNSGNGAGTAGSHVKVWSASAAGGAQAITVAPTSFGEEHSLYVIVFTGACTVDGAAGGNGTGTTLHVSPAVSTAGSPRLLFSVVTSNGAVAGSYLPPPGMAEITELDDATFAFTASLGSETLLNAGSTGTRTWTYSSSSGVYAAVSIAVKGVAASSGTNANADVAAGSGVAQDAAVAVTANADIAPGTGAAPDATAALGANAESPAGTGTAYDATVSTTTGASAPAEVATGAGTANDTLAAVGANAESPTGAGAALDAGTATGANAEVPSAAGSAFDALADLAATAGQSAGSGVAQDATAAVTINAEQPGAAGIAYDATVSTSAAANASAEAAASTGTAQDASIALTVNAEAPTSVGTANDAISATGANAGVPTGTGAAADGTAAVTVNAEAPSGTGTAYDATVSTLAITNAPADIALGTGTGQDAAASIGANAGSSAAAGVAFDATVSTVVATNAPAEAATVVATAYDASVAITSTSGFAAATGTAGDAGPSVGGLPGAASGTGTAWPASIALAVAADVALATGQAFGPSPSYDATIIAVGIPVVTGDPGTAGVTGDWVPAGVTGDVTMAGVG